jgi:hypothetical protein
MAGFGAPINGRFCAPTDTSHNNRLGIDYFNTCRVTRG